MVEIDKKYTKKSGRNIKYKIVPTRNEKPEKISTQRSKVKFQKL